MNIKYKYKIETSQYQKGYYVSILEFGTVFRPITHCRTLRQIIEYVSSVYHDWLNPMELYRKSKTSEPITGNILRRTE